MCFLVFILAFVWEYANIWVEKYFVKDWENKVTHVACRS